MARAPLPARHEDQRRRASSSACDYIARKFADRPDLREAVTPTYPYPGKRPVFASTFYPALKKENVELVPRAVASVTPHRHRRRRRGGASRRRHRDGHRLPTRRTTSPASESWAATAAPSRSTGPASRTPTSASPCPGSRTSSCSTGPGTNGGEIVIMLESQAEYAVRAMKRMIRERVTAVEVKPSFEARWYRWLQSTMEGTSWTMSNNYFKSPTGQDRDAVALRQPALPRADEAPGPRVGDDPSARWVK